MKSNYGKNLSANEKRIIGAMVEELIGKDFGKYVSKITPYKEVFITSQQPLATKNKKDK